MSDGAADEAAFAPVPPSRARYLAVGIVVPLVLLLLAAWFGAQFQQIDTTRAIARASYEKRFSAADFLRTLDEAESAQRGYVITGDAAFVSTYRAAQSNARQALDRLDSLYAKDPQQAARLERLRQLVNGKLAEMTDVIALRRDRGLPAAVQRISDRQGVLIMDQAHGLVVALIDTEQSMLADRIQAVLDRYKAVQRFVWAMMAAAGLALWVMLWWGWRIQSDRYQAGRRAYAAAARHEAIFASTTDAILILDAEGRIENANAAATHMLGHTAGELVGQDAAPLIGLAPGGGSFPERIGFRDGQIAQPHWLDRTLRHKQGHEVPVDIALGLMPLPGRTGVVAAIRDISERKTVERLKDEFVSTVSHELRTPLTSVVGSLGLLRSGSVGELPDAARRLVEIAENNSRRLIRLINDILDIDKIGSGRMHFESEPLDIVRMLEGAVETSQGLADAKRVRLVMEIAERPLIVQGDTDRLHQVVINLLSNAIRFSPEGGTVRAVVASETGQAVVAVEDEGPGIPAEFRGRVFERFSQSNEGAAMGGGTGLGLAISREIVMAHQGRIWFGEAPGGGARLAFSLPLQAPDPRMRSGARPRILVSQGQADAADILRSILEKEGCLVDCVGTAQAVQEAARSGRYDGIILDVALPDGNGLEVVRALRRRADTRLLPIIVVSGGITEETAGTAALEVIDWIDKPVDQERLVRAVRRAVEHSAATRPTLLHVDDDVDMLEVTATALADQGRMLRATTVTSAREILANEPPDIVILDVALPDGSGLELLPDLLLADGTAIPTIIYSATDVLPEVGRQVDAVLVKSRRSLPNLAQTIRRLLADIATTDDG